MTKSPPGRNKNPHTSTAGTAVLKREVAVLNRVMEFFTEKELTARMGAGPGSWPAILVKELIDNALDAAEGAGPPSIEVTVDEAGFSVADNGLGLPAEIIKRSLDYSVRVSDKSLYVTPTRGQLGNALKCVWAAPFVAIGNKASSVTVLTGGHRHTIRVSADQIQGCPLIERATENGLSVRTGTSVAVAWPGAASYQGDGDGLDFYRVVQGFAALNPHATFRYRRAHDTPVTFQGTDRAWRKWAPTYRPPPHWYDLDRFRSLVAGKLAAARRSGAEPPTVRDFIAENFRGLTSTVVRSGLLRGCGLDGATLAELAPGGEFDDARLAGLLTAMKQHARPVQPEKLGPIGKAHMTAAAVNLFGAAEHTVRYRRAMLEVGGLPYVLEVAFGYHNEDTPRAVIAGINWSPPTKSPFDNLGAMLRDGWVDQEDPCVVIVHLACPRPEFTDTGKTALKLPDQVWQALRQCVRYVTLAWYELCRKARRDRDRRERLEQSAIAESLRREKAGFLSIKEASRQVLPEAIQDASGNGSRPANARQVGYSVRRLILQRKLTDPDKGKDGFFKHFSSFTQSVLPDYMEENPEATKDWDVAFDDRGHFAEPHTGVRIGLGTVAVREYVADWQHDVPDGGVAVQLSSDVQTCGPANRYRFALFVEKEGFDALLASAQIQERYDLALMSTKGMSVTAARQLVERLSRGGVTVLVLHDFDKSGLSILHTLRSDTRRYRYGTTPKVIDIGLRLKDVTALGLVGERVTYATKADPRENLRESGATKAERNFLVSGGRPRRWEGRRVELNELTSPQFITFLEGKLREAGVGKVVPEGEALAAAYRLQRKRAKLQQAIDEAAKGIDGEAVEMPPGLREDLAEMIQDKSISWDLALWEFVNHEGKGK
jgi:DNA topoisomerase VI subunit B